MTDNKKAKVSKLWTPDFIRLVIWQVLVFNGLTSITGTFSVYAVERFNASPVEIGVISSVLIFSAFLFRPVAGILIDRFGRRITTAMALVPMIIFNPMLMLPDTLFGLGILRFLMGLPFAMITTANSALRTDIIPGKHRMDGFSITAITMIFSALVIGPNLGFLILQIADFPTLFIVSSALFLIALILFTKMRFKDITTEKITFSFSDILEPRVMWITLILGINFIGWPGILNFGPLYAEEVGLAFAGLLFTAYGVGLIISRPVIKFTERRGAPLSLKAVGVLALIAGHAIIGFVNHPRGFLFGMVFLGLGYGYCFAVLQKLAFDLVEPERRGRCAATIYLNQNLGSTIGRFIFGYTAQSAGTYAVTYQISAAVCVVPLFILLFISLPDYKRKLSQINPGIN